MSKIRVHEYAKKHNISSKDLMTKLKEMNIEVSNHMTMLDDEVVNKLDNEYQTEKPSVADEFEVEEKVVRSKKNSNKKKKKGKGNEDKRQENFAGRQQTQIVETPDKITFSGSLTVGDLAKKLSKEQESLIDNNEIQEEKKETKKDKISLQEIDDRLMTIDDFLK